MLPPPVSAGQFRKQRSRPMTEAVSLFPRPRRLSSHLRVNSEYLRAFDRHGGTASVKDKTLRQLTSQKVLLFLKVGGGLLLGGRADLTANSVQAEIGLRFLFMFRLKNEVGFELLLQPEPLLAHGSSKAARTAFTAIKLCL